MIMWDEVMLIIAESMQLKNISGFAVLIKTDFKNNNKWSSNI